MKSAVKDLFPCGENAIIIKEDSCIGLGNYEIIAQ
jgi:hypothetical protein